MSPYVQFAFDWLQMKLPHSSALISGMLVGIFGLVSLSFLAWALAPAAMVTWLPVILFFCAANAGYRLTQKRIAESDSNVRPYLGLLATITFCVAATTQIGIDTQIFHSSPSSMSLMILVLCAVIGTWAGSRLRFSYEQLQTQAR
jgi:intracellular septation protein A